MKYFIILISRTATIKPRKTPKLVDLKSEFGVYQMYQNQENFMNHIVFFQEFLYKLDTFNHFSHPVIEATYIAESSENQKPKFLSRATIREFHQTKQPLFFMMCFCLGQKQSNFDSRISNAGKKLNFDSIFFILQN